MPVSRALSFCCVIVDVIFFLIIVTGFKVGGGEAVSAQNQPGTPREGTLHDTILYQPSLFSYIEVANTVRDDETTLVLKSTFRYGVLASDR